MPAAAVIPAPGAHLHVVAVKTLVVGALVCGVFDPLVALGASARNGLHLKPRSGGVDL